ELRDELIWVLAIADGHAQQSRLDIAHHAPELHIAYPSGVIGAARIRRRIRAAEENPPALTDQRGKLLRACDDFARRELPRLPIAVARHDAALPVATAVFSTKNSTPGSAGTGAPSFHPVQNVPRIACSFAMTILKSS